MKTKSTLHIYAKTTKANATPVAPAGDEVNVQVVLFAEPLAPTKNWLLEVSANIQAEPGDVVNGVISAVPVKLRFTWYLMMTSLQVVPEIVSANSPGLLFGVFTFMVVFPPAKVAGSIVQPVFGAVHV